MGTEWTWEAPIWSATLLQGWYLEENVMISVFSSFRTSLIEGCPKYINNPLFLEPMNGIQYCFFLTAKHYAYITLTVSSLMQIICVEPKIVPCKVVAMQHIYELICTLNIGMPSMRL